jgi:hypothetical protein
MVITKEAFVDPENEREALAASVRKAALLDELAISALAEAAAAMEKEP